MSTNLAPDTELAERLFDTLRERSFDGVGITRTAYGEGEAMAHALLAEEGDKLGLERRVDPIGNQYLTLPGADRSRPAIVLGSHLDSVAQGGNFDGAAGVLAGLAAVAGLVKAGYTPAQDVTVMCIRAEEAGEWFPTSYPGSRGSLGMLTAADLAVKRRDSGRSLAEHMREEGFDPSFAEAGKKVLGPHNVAGFLELHIEQGPTLEGEGKPLGIVTGIPGSRRFRAARVVGEYNHSGATARKYRKDAVAAAAELAYRLDEYWCELDAQGRRMVVTFCEMATTADAGFTKISGEVKFSLDIRAVNMENCDLMVARLHQLIAEIEARRGVTFELGTESGSTPSIMDAAMQAGLAKAADDLKVGHISMASGAGHDTAAFVQAGVPGAMLFVRNQNGSHNPHEAMRAEDFALACQVITRWLQDVTQ
ncbi:Zn-dependent hydrolase [Rhodovarius crocodyli]|uniref:Zn-dependent hydrolase n=1 Tax=Rhodovarius crocodyli TaxID=1979269 RepID=A0A437M1L0_9PROT|nr:hydantoinase/carbamoylase family amidase [Rhodovarius crocodyli]RVT91599.1 Zn-dependent hydrolase [Rhodovarius crocodyli]